MAKVIEVTLEQITVNQNGRVDSPDDPKANNKIILSLIYPKAGQPIVVTIREVKLADGIPFEYDEATHGFDKKLVFKEEVEGNFAICVSVTSEMKASVFEKAVSKALTEGIKFALGKVPVVGKHLTGLEAPISEFLEADDDIAVIGKGINRLQATNALDVSLTFDLVVPEEVKVKTVSPSSTSADPEFTVLKLEKGTPNGQVSLKYSISG